MATGIEQPAPTDRIADPANEDESVMAAIIYAEAKVTRDAAPTTEMLAVGWTLRNRYLHVRKTYGANDKKWFGSGNTLESVATHGREFVSVSGPRYRNFRKNRAIITHPAEVHFGNLCIQAARQILAEPEPITPGISGTYPYIWFQKSSRRPSSRASVNASPHGEHNFWSFAPGRERG
jgi:hypothetical protein